MNVKPIGVRNLNYKANKDVIDKDGDYVDPLMNWPLRGAAFSNEVGEAMRPMIGNFANLTWIPVLMYIGADVYDKYKNDQTEYSPNSRRCLKQAIFQGLASVCLPVVAVKFGQNAFSQLGKFSKDKVSVNTKEHISQVANQFIENGKMRRFQNRPEECKKEFLAQVNDSFDYNRKKKSLKNIFNIFGHDKKENIEKYAKQSIEELIETRNNLLHPTVSFQKNPIYKKYTKVLKNGQEENNATKIALSDFQKKKLMKGNILKTLGGFIALGLAIKPIDAFVENVLIEKYVGPRIDNFKSYKK